MKFLSELIIYWVVKFFGAVVRILPIRVSLSIGKMLGMVAYYLNAKHRKIAYSNLNVAFSKTKSPEEIRRIAKETFANFGQNLIELFRFPLMNTDKFREFVQLEGAEHIDNAIKDGKGVILLAMHSGSWEMANLIGAMLGHPYKVLVKPQEKFSRLGELLNSFRRSGGSTVVERGMGTRELLKGLKNNEVVALVVDQGGRDGMRIPFFGKDASLSVGAVRLGLKMDVPICFVSIVRKKGPYHRLVINKPLALTRTGDADKDVSDNLKSIAAIMEENICRNPSEYMWFYRIWKYSKEAVIGIITDGKAGHLRQAEAVAGLLKMALAERGILASLPILHASFKNKFLARFFSVTASLGNLLKHRGRIFLLRLCLTPDSFDQIFSVKPDFIISCGSSVAPVNYLLSQEHDVKTVAIQKPGILGFRDFDLVILPRHDKSKRKWPDHVVVTQGSPNLVTSAYLDEYKNALVKRYSHLKSGDNFKIGVLLGGDTPEFILSEQRVRVLLHQLMEAAEETQADILLTTSRRTSPKVENLIMRELRKYHRCKFLIIANRENIPEAVGGILGLSDVIVVSGDSISMVSEAASSGKKVAAFFVESRNGAPFEKTKHGRFLERLSAEGYVLSSDVRYMKDSLYKLIKNKVQTRTLDDAALILEHLRKFI